MFNKFRNYFFAGIAILFPIAITIVIVRFLVININNIILQPLVEILNLSPYLSRHSLFIAKGLVFLGVIVLIAFLGWTANIIFLRKLFSFGEKIIVKLPMVGKIYSVTKELGFAFLGHGKAIFKKVVLIEYPRKGVYSIGFTTGGESRSIKESVCKELITVFVPTTPNPTSGIFLLVPKEEAVFLDMSVEEGLKIIISSGAVMPGGPKKCEGDYNRK